MWHTAMSSPHLPRLIMDFVTQIPLWQQIKNLIAADRMPQVLLLQGPEGSGKLATARRLAQLLQCESPTPDGEPCGVCRSCRQHLSFNNIDTSYVFPVVKGNRQTVISDDFSEQWHKFLNEGGLVNDFEEWSSMLDKKAIPQIYVYEAQNLIRKLSTTSHSAPYKVAVIWLPELMNISCANKLLKIVEEPYDDVRLIFVSNNPDEILPTLKSRCQSMEFTPLSTDFVERWLHDDQGMPVEDARVIANISDGNLAEARRLARADVRRSMFLELFMRLMRLAYQRNVAALRVWAHDLNALGRDTNVKFYQYAQRMVRENFMLNFGEPSLNSLAADEGAFSKNFARFITERNVEQLINEFEAAAHDVAANGNGKIINFDVALRVILLLK